MTEEITLVSTPFNPHPDPFKYIIVCLTLTAFLSMLCIGSYSAPPSGKSFASANVMDVWP